MTTTLAPLRAAIYARFSSDEPGSDSVETQLHYARQAAKAHAWATDERHVFTDDGVSGREMVRRPGFRALREAAGRREFSVIVVRDLDRFARGEEARVLGLLQELADVDVRLWQYSKKEWVRIDGEHALITTVNAYANRQEAVKAGTRIREKIQKRDEDGGITSQAPFGFLNRRRKADGTIGEFPPAGTFSVVVQHRDEYPVLKVIADEFLRLRSFNAVATVLNQGEVPSPSGRVGGWAANTVRNILRNPAYRGQLVRGKTIGQDKGGTLTRVASPEALRVYEHPELRVWDEQTLAAIDAVIATRKRARSWALGRTHLSSSFVKCGVCGSAVAAISGSRNRYFSYACTRIRAHACEGIGYRAERAVDAAVIGACLSAVTDQVIKETVRIVRDALSVREQGDARALEMERFRNKIAVASRRVRGLTDGVAEAEDRAARAHLIAALSSEQQKLRDLQTGFAALQQAPAPLSPKIVLRELEARAKGIRARLSGTFEEKLGAVQDVLGTERFTATRLPDKAWRLRASVPSLAATLYMKVGNSQTVPVKRLPLLDGRRAATAMLSLASSPR